MGSWVGYREFEAEDGQTRRDFVRRVTPAGRLSLSSTPAGCAGHATKQDAVAAVRASFAGYPRAHGIRYGAVRLVEQDTPDPASGAGAGRRVVSVSDTTLQQLQHATAVRQRAEAKAAQAAEQQYAAIRAALEAGSTSYRVAQVTGLTQRAVHKIRDGLTGQTG